MKKDQITDMSIFVIRDPRILKSGSDAICEGINTDTNPIINPTIKLHKTKINPKYRL